MYFEISDENGRSIEVVSGAPGLFPYYEDAARHYSATGDFGDALFQYYEGDGFTVWFSRYIIARPSALKARSDLSALELHIAVLNQIEGTWDGIDNPSVPPYHFNLSFTPHVNTCARFEQAKPYETCDIHFTVPFLETFAAESPLLDRFLHNVTKDDPCDLTAAHYYCSPEMIRNVLFISSARINRRHLKTLMECKVKEILMEALEKAETSLTKPRPLRLSPTDIERLHEAKRIITTSSEGMPSYQQICKAALLNEFKLKKGFRTLFNATPYQFYVQMKMERAKLMLTSTDLPVADIAHMSDYQFDYNFSIEFKRYTGWTPQKYRRQFREY